MPIPASGCDGGVRRGSDASKALAMGARAVGKGRPYVLGLTAFGQDCLTSQLPVSRWHEQIGDPTVAGGIPDRLVHNAHA